MGDLFRAAQRIQWKTKDPITSHLGLHHICQSSPGGGDRTCVLHTAGNIRSLEREPHHYHMEPPQAQYSPPTLNTGNAILLIELLHLFITVAALL